MKKNIGKLDRLARLALGLVALVVALYVGAFILKIVLVLFGIFCVLEAMLSRCALYAILGKNTCPIE